MPSSDSGTLNLAFENEEKHVEGDNQPVNANAPVLASDCSVINLKGIETELIQVLDVKKIETIDNEMNAVEIDEDAMKDQEENFKTSCKILKKCDSFAEKCEEIIWRRILDDEEFSHLISVMYKKCCNEVIVAALKSHKDAS